MHSRMQTCPLEDVPVERQCELTSIKFAKIKEVHRVYTIMDDQTNASIISTKLADKLNTEDP